MSAANTKNVQTRLAQLDDLDNIGRLIGQFLTKMRAEATVKEARRVMEQILKSPDLGIVIVAEHPEGLCGYAYASFLWRCEFGGETMDIVELFVEEAWRNKGVGSSLTGALLDTARSRKIHRISAEVHPGNAAIERTLESNGFDPEHRTLWGLEI